MSPHPRTSSLHAQGQSHLHFILITRVANLVAIFPEGTSRSNAFTLSTLLNYLNAVTKNSVISMRHHLYVVTAPPSTYYTASYDTGHLASGRPQPVGPTEAEGPWKGGSRRVCRLEDIRSTIKLR
jgi:hypothetical protein